MIAMIAYPLSKRIEAAKIPRWIATGLSISAVALVFAAIFTLLVIEAEIIYQKSPELLSYLQARLPDFQTWLTDTFGWTAEAQSSWLNQTIEKLFGDLASLINRSVTATAHLLLNIIIIPLFAALILHNRETYTKAFASLFSAEMQSRLPQVLNAAVTTYFKYIAGMLQVYIIVGLLNSLGLMILGIENAWLYGMIAAFMTIIPVVGILISGILPVSIALVTKDSMWYAVGVVGVFSVVQYLEANVIYPKVVGAKLNINMLATLLIILAGSLLWGVAGMILLLPMVAILKLISKDLPGWETIDLLLSNKPKS